MRKRHKKKHQYPNQAAFLATDLPIYYSTVDAAAYLDWPLSRLHDRTYIREVQPQLMYHTFVYSKRQLFLYKKSKYNKWPDTIDAEIILTADEAAAMLSNLWGINVSAWKLRKFSKKNNYPQFHKIGRCRFYSKGEITQFSIFYRTVFTKIEKRKRRYNVGNPVQGTSSTSDDGILH